MQTHYGIRCIVLGLVLTAWAGFSQAAEKVPWGPSQATGKPDSLVPGDQQTAWATLEPNKGSEWIRFEYQTAVEVQAVRIHENFNPGAVSRVTAISEDGTESLIWEGEEPAKPAPNVFEVTATRDVKSQSVKITLDTKRVAGWNEIDAVQLVGKDGSTQWAVAASASSTFASSLPSYENQPASVVRTIPQAGDLAVDPSLKEIQVTFSKDMITDRMWSFVQISNDNYPKTPEGKSVHYLADKRTCVKPVELEPNKTYVIWINQGRFNSFRDVQGKPSVPYLLVFKTKE